MARRMLSDQITDSEAFLDMPQSTQLLYFHLNIKADDDGFIKNPKQMMRFYNCSEDDLKLLIMKHFVLPFPNGVMVIKHWLMHNSIRKDRYHPTAYFEELNQLSIKENGAYTWKNQDDNQLTTKTQILGNQLATEDKLSKVKLSEVNKKIPQEVGQSVARGSKSENKGGIELANYIGDNEELQEAVKQFIKMRKEIRKPMTDQAKSLLVKEMQKLEKSGENIVDCLNASILNSWQGLFPKRKQPLNKGVEVPSWIDTNIKPHIQENEEIDVEELVNDLQRFK